MGGTADRRKGGGGQDCGNLDLDQLKMNHTFLELEACIYSDMRKT